jgi:hypothetical protein
MTQIEADSLVNSIDSGSGWDIKAAEGVCRNYLTNTA